MYYYGARYYDPRTSVWLSVDPLTEQTMTPYQYTYQNPVRYIDPTGMAAEGPGDPPKTLAGKFINWIGNLFRGKDRGREVPVGELTIGEMNVRIMEGEIIGNPGDTWSADGYTFRHIEGFTILRSKNGEYAFGALDEGMMIAPADQGAFGTTGSGGLYWKGCRSCHHPDGAYKYLAYNNDRTAFSKSIGILPSSILGGGSFGAIKGGSKLFGKDVSTMTTRMGRDGKAVEIIFTDGSKIDINAARVKQWVPQTHPNAPPGTLDRVRFNNLRGSRGFKRPPNQSELDFLNGL